jgi:hypothetical protein
MRRILDLDDPNLLTVSSAAVFDNRVLFTTAPALEADHGVFHRGFSVLDNDVLSGMRGKLPPVYDGLWTGLNTLQIVEGEFQFKDRCFALVLNRNIPTTPKIELWEIMRETGYDEIGNTKVPISWLFETAAFFKDKPFALKRLINGVLFVKNMFGRVRFRVLWRPDDHPCWIPWASWEECAPEQFCPDLDAPLPAPLKPQVQFRVRMPFGAPPTDCDPITNKPYRNFYRLQIRLEISGQCEISGLMLHAVSEPEVVGRAEVSD